jgi:hypothetical protein
VAPTAALTVGGCPAGPASTRYPVGATPPAGAFQRTSATAPSTSARVSTGACGVRNTVAVNVRVSVMMPSVKVTVMREVPDVPATGVITSSNAPSGDTKSKSKLELGNTA